MSAVAGAGHAVRVPWWRYALLIVLLVQLCACGSTPVKPAQVRKPRAPTGELVDSAPPAGMDLSNILEPVPRDEPRSRYGNHSPYVVYGKRYSVLPDNRGYRARGTASWYGTKFHGRLTSNREPYDMYAYTAAHKTLPLPSYARVTNLENGRSAIVRINDRGPFVGDRLIDLSYVAAVKLGVHIKGTAPVEVEVIDTGPAVVDVPRAPAAVVPPPVTAPTSPAVAAARPATEPQLQPRFFQQCGAFGERDNARMLEARLRGALASPVTVLQDGAGAPYRVVVGPYADRIAAIAAESELARQGFPGCHVLVR